MNVKKILAVLAVTGCALTGLSSVESANIVGYNSKQTGEHPYSFFGATFTPVGGAKSFRLVDIKAENCTPGDWFQLINGDNLMNLDGIYAYVSEEYADGDDTVVGWYDLDKGDVFDPGAKIGNDVLFLPNDAYLCDMSSSMGDETKFQFPSSTKVLDE